MSEPFIGEIRMFGGSFAPRGWALCDGQVLPIAENFTLWTLLGATYGGDGRTTFALPDLRGRVPIHQGTGPGLSPRALGEAGGVETLTLLSSELPPHRHPLHASIEAAAPTAGPEGSVPAHASAFLYGDPVAGMVPLGPVVESAGGAQPHDNVAPFQCVTFIIALSGVYPLRN